LRRWKLELLMNTLAEIIVPENLRAFHSDVLER
jgi:hypothetical protein